MREYETTLGGETVTLAATFKAAQDVAQKVADPLTIAREAAIEDVALKVGAFQHQPKWRFTVENVPVLFHIGIKAAGGNQTMEQVQALVFAEGFISARDKATEYLALIIGPRSEEITASEGDNSSGE